MKNTQISFEGEYRFTSYVQQLLIESERLITKDGAAIIISKHMVLHCYKKSEGVNEVNVMPIGAPAEAFTVPIPATKEDFVNNFYKGFGFLEIYNDICRTKIATKKLLELLENTKL